MGLVARRRRLRRAGHARQIFGGADDPRRRPLPAERAGRPALALPSAALCRGAGGAGAVPAGGDLECPPRLGIVPVSGRAGGGRTAPAGAFGDERRRRAVSAALALAGAAPERLCGAAARAGRGETLALGLSGGAAARLLHRGFAVEPRAVSLGRTGLSDAGAVARRRHRPARPRRPAGPPLADRDRRNRRPRRRRRRQRGPVQLAALCDLSGRQRPGARRGRLDLAAPRTRRARPARPARTGRRRDPLARCRQARLRPRRPGRRCCVSAPTRGNTV